MREAVIAEVSTQLSEVVGVTERHLEPTLLAVHLYGSAVMAAPVAVGVILICRLRHAVLDETTRRALIKRPLKLRLPGESEISSGGCSHHCCAR